MPSRTTSTTATFAHPFLLLGSDTPLPAGSYEVIVEEDLLEGLSFEAYRRTGTYLRVDGRGGTSGVLEMRPIDPQDLEAALARDRIQGGSSGMVAPEP